MVKLASSLYIILVSCKIVVGLIVGNVEPLVEDELLERSITIFVKLDNNNWSLNISQRRKT